MNGALTRLRWQCRRGMLEMDELLGHFLERRYAGLSAQLREGFETLLGYPDNVLSEWFFGQGKPLEPIMVELVERILAEYRSISDGAPPEPGGAEKTLDAE